MTLRSSATAGPTPFTSRKRCSGAPSTCARVPNRASSALATGFVSARGMRCCNGACAVHDQPKHLAIAHGKLSLFPYQSQSEEYGMKLFIGLDVSLAKTAVCVINEYGKIAKEAQVPSDP